MIKERKRRSLRVQRNLKLRTRPVRRPRIIGQLTKNRNNNNRLLNSLPRHRRHHLPHPHPLKSSKRKKRRGKKRSLRHYPNRRKLQVAATANTRHHHPHLKGTGHQRERRRLTLQKIAEGNEREVNLHEIGGESAGIPRFLLEGGRRTTHDHPPLLDETEGRSPVHSLLLEDVAKIIAPLLPEGGENPITHHHLPGKDFDDRSRPRQEAGNVEKKGCRPHPLLDAVGLVRRLPLLVG